MTQHLMNGRGKLEPHDRSSRVNGFLDWSGTARTDDPSGLAAALVSPVLEGLAGVVAGGLLVLIWTGLKRLRRRKISAE